MTKYVDFYFEAPDESSFMLSMADFEQDGVLVGEGISFDLDVKVITDLGVPMIGYFANIRALEPSTSLKAKLRSNPFWIGDRSQSGYENGLPPESPAREFAS